MARNEEKAQSMLNRFITMKESEKKKLKERRPYLASECRDLADAYTWRQQIVQEISHKVVEIQNEGLGEHRLRDLNDEINKLLREKDHWERQFVELGGPKMTDPKKTWSTSRTLAAIDISVLLKTFQELENSLRSLRS